MSKSKQAENAAAEEQPKGKRWEWMKSLLIAVAIALVVRWLFAEPFQIPSGSMEPTLHGDPRVLRGDRVFVNKLVYGVRYPLNWFRIPFTTTRIHYADSRLINGKPVQRWDIVVFKGVEDGKITDTLVKRVVGLPGETINIRGGKVYADGKPLELKPDMPDIFYTSPHGGFTDMRYGVLEDEKYAKVPDDCYLVLGDNSMHSRDGRVFGWLPGEHILGRVSCIWWPIGRWHDFTGFSQTWWWRSIVTLLGVWIFWRMFIGRSWRSIPAGGAKVLHWNINRISFGLPVPFTRYRFFRGRAPKRGELVLYWAPAEAGQAEPIMGRVAAFAGERIAFDGEVLKINDATCDDAGLLPGLSAEGVDSGLYGRSRTKDYAVVAEDCVMIIVDPLASDDTLDSRKMGWIPVKSIVGGAMSVWWPPSQCRCVRCK